MGIFRFFRYKYILSSRRRKYASLAVSIALAHASFGSVKYRSLGNGMADIQLSLDQDQQFRLHFNRLDEAKEYVMKGKWTVSDDNYVLKFGRSKLDVPTLFSSNTGLKKASFIQDKRTVKIPSTRNGVVIWGIFCPKA
ncbi:MAG: hypothetical protein HQ500_02465 [Flavobacteriales bacterium]|nr:hypothetical protein [Flavobacteriales bacterium]